MQSRRSYWIVLLVLVIALCVSSTLFRSRATMKRTTFESVGSQEAALQSEASEFQQPSISPNADALASLSQSEYLRTTDFPVSLLLGIEAFRTADTFRTRAALLENNQSHPLLSRYLYPKAFVIESVAFSPDGKTLAMASDGTVELWDVQAGQKTAEWQTGHTKVVFSPTGKLLTSAGMSSNTTSSITFWDLRNHQPLGPSITFPTPFVPTIAFSPDGRILASDDDNGNIILWDVASRQPVGSQLPGDGKAIYTLAFSPDGKILASAGKDDFITLWNVNTHQPEGQPLVGHTDSVNRVAFSPDGKLLASGGSDQAVIIWNVSTHQSIGRPLLKHSGAVSSVAFTPDGLTLASASDDQTIILWDVATHQPTGSPLTGQTMGIWDLAISPDGKKMASAGMGRTPLVLWNLSSESLGKTLVPFGRVTAMVFSPDGNTLTSGNDDGTITFWNMANGQPIGQQPSEYVKGPVQSLAYMRNGSILAIGRNYHTITFWDVSSKKTTSLPLDESGIHSYCVAYAADSRTLATKCIDGAITLWDVSTQRKIGQILTGNSDDINRLAFSPDGKILVSGGSEGKIIFWDVASHNALGAPILPPSGSQGIAGLVFTPDGRILVSAYTFGPIVLWDVHSHKIIRQLSRIDLWWIAPMGDLAVSSDGKEVAASALDAIELWDLATGRSIGEPLGQNGLGLASGGQVLAFSPNGKLLASGGCNLAGADYNCDERRITLIDMDPQILIEKSCQRAGRNFTQDEWSLYFPGENYRITCPEYPSRISANPMP